MYYFLVLVWLQVVSAESGIGYFWHVSDFHLDTNFTYNELQKNNKDYFVGNYKYDICWKQGGQGQFGDYDCDAPLALVKSAVGFIKQKSRSITDGTVDFVIWTGDDTSHAENKYHSQTNVLDAIGNITYEMKTIGLPVYPVLGNHDMFPHNQLSGNPYNFLYVKTAEMWRDWYPNQVYEEYKSHAGFYQIAPNENFGFRMVGLNTNLYYMSNHATEGTKDPGGQFSWLKSVLENATLSKEKVLLFCHIPPGKFERFYQFYQEEDQYGFPWFRDEYNKQYIDIISNYTDVIHLQLYGHHHTDSFKIFKSPRDHKPVGFGLLAPAVTPWRSTLAPETGANNPGLRLFKYNTTSKEILDYEQFWLNLTQANVDGKDEWKSEYAFKQYYNVTQLSTQEMYKLLQRIHDDQKVFDKYLSANVVQMKDACNSSCKPFHYCAMAELDYDRYETCLYENGIPHHNNQAASILNSSVIFALISTFTVLL